MRLMTHRVMISEDILRWLRTQVQPEALPPKVAAYLNNWGRGEATPTFEEIEEISRATGIPFGYFFLKEPPAEDLSFLTWRTVGSDWMPGKPSRALIDTVHHMELVQDWMRNHLHGEGATKLPLVGTGLGETDPLRLAELIRNILDLPVDWFLAFANVRESFNYLCEKMSSSGVIVMTSETVTDDPQRLLNINEFRAFDMADGLAPLIFVNGNDSEDGKLFSLLHAFAHLCIGHNCLLIERYVSQHPKDHEETICEVAVTEILVPGIQFAVRWSELTDILDIEQIIDCMAAEFRCSKTLIAKRALEKDQIDNLQYKKIVQIGMSQLDKRGMDLPEDCDSENVAKAITERLDHRFLRMLVSSVETGETLYTDAFRLTNTNRFTFRELVEQLKGGGNR